MKSVEDRVFRPGFLTPQPGAIVTAAALNSDAGESPELRPLPAPVPLPAVVPDPAP